MSAQEKVPKEKGTPAALIGWRRSLPFLANPGARTTRDLAMLDSLKQSARLDPGLAAVLSECKRVWVGRFLVLMLMLMLNLPTRLAQPSIAVKTGASSRLFERSELRERRALREAQGTRVAGKPPGSPFFWVLFFGGAKKSISPEWAKQTD